MPPVPNSKKAMIHGCPENEDGSLWRCTEWAHCSTKYLPGHQDEILNQKLQRKVEQREREEKRVAALHDIKVPASPPPCFPALSQQQRAFPDDDCLRLCCCGVEVAASNSKSQHRATPSADWASYLEQNGFLTSSLHAPRFEPPLCLFFLSLSFSSQITRHRSRVADAAELNCCLFEAFQIER